MPSYLKQQGNYTTIPQLDAGSGKGRNRITKFKYNSIYVQELGGPPIKTTGYQAAWYSTFGVLFEYMELISPLDGAAYSYPLWFQLDVRLARPLQFR